mmetsp:Transcript_112809/g.329651  ORF Transcript_112809/g.329651 Transcript_112809/m.329651 type:complete len:226 (+) Transcript_112809:3523-4200(+)
MNIRQMDACVLAAVAADSQALTVFMVSSSGSSSTPIRNGPSASAARPTASCTDCSFSPASFSSSSQVTRSAASLCEFLSCPIRVSATLILSWHLVISANTTPFAFAWLFFCSMSLPVVDTCSVALFSASSACCSSSLLKPGPLRRLLASSALSTSSSAGVSSSRMSSTTFFAAWRCMKSWRADFKGLSLFWASCSCCWSLASSVAAMVRILSLSNRFTAACFAFR